MSFETRKNEEKNFHNILRDVNSSSPQDQECLIANKKWYSVVRFSRSFVDKWLKECCRGKKVLDYCCGNGQVALKIADFGASEVRGIDISDISINNAIKSLSIQDKTKNIDFYIMDAENTLFADNSFDVIHESGVLHHLDLPKAYAEISRILKPDGRCICIEALGHNRLIQYYREKTPHLRTAWETKHILFKKDILMAEKYFNKVELIGFFHLFTLLAVPFRRASFFNSLLSFLEFMDKVFLKLPFVKWHSWQVVFVLSQPRKQGLKC